jgi:hypothetical protein
MFVRMSSVMPSDRYSFSSRPLRLEKGSRPAAWSGPAPAGRGSIREVPPAPAAQRTCPHAMRRCGWRGVGSARDAERPDARYGHRRRTGGGTARRWRAAARTAAGVAVHVGARHDRASGTARCTAVRGGLSRFRRNTQAPVRELDLPVAAAHGARDAGVRWRWGGWCTRAAAVWGRCRWWRTRAQPRRAAPGVGGRRARRGTVTPIGIERLEAYGGRAEKRSRTRR